MAERDINIVIKANEDFVAGLAKAQSLFQEFSKLLDTSLSSYLKVFQEAQKAQTAAATIGQDAGIAARETMNLWDRLNKSALAGFEGLLKLPDKERKRERREKLEEEAGAKGLQGKEQNTYADLGASLDFYALTEKQKTDLLSKYVKDRKAIRAEELASIAVSNEMHAWSEKARESVVSKSYDAMGQEMLNFIERGRFSTEEFGKIIVQQVKLELVGIAARAAIYAIYETAVALAASTGPWGLATFGNPAGHWASAGTFASISGASLAAAYGVQNVIQGGRDESKDGASGASASARSLRGSSSSPVVPALPLAAQPQTRPERNITVNIYNPISGKDVREAIVDIINEAGDMNYKINAKIIEAV